MGTPNPTRLLLVSADLRLEEEVRHSLVAARVEADLKVCRTADALSDAIADPSVQVVLLAESGLHHRSAERIAEEFTRIGKRPIIFLGDAPGGHLHLLHRHGAECIAFPDLDRLPLAIEQTLRRFEAEQRDAHLHGEIQRAADAVGRDQKLITIGRLAGSIAHEINNPLESITNLLYLTAHEPGLPSQARSYLEMAQNELTRVVEISKQTLTFNRETAEPVCVSITDLLEEVLGLYRRRVAEKCISVQRDYTPGASAQVFPGEIRQVFSNLVSNALEAMEAQGCLRIRVRASVLPRDGRTPALRISVADTGSGMDRQVREHLGRPFFTTKGQRGTGLGLWVTQSILRRHGGSLRLRSRTGERHGTVFTVFLPVGFWPEQALDTSALEAQGAREKHEKMPEIRASNSVAHRSLAEDDSSLGRASGY